MPSVKNALRSAVEYSGTGNWIYSRRILEWTSTPEIVRQLPPGIRVFCAYVTFYKRWVGTPTILMGHGIFRLAQIIDGGSIRSMPLHLGGHEIWLDLKDPGFLWAIQELSVGSDQTRLIADLASSADIFVDVGANQGIFTAVANSVMRTGAEIIAIEPQPILADCLEATFAATPSRQGRVARFIVSDHLGEACLSVPEENKGEAHVAATNAGPQTLRVASTTLDTLLVDVPADANVLVKMDIEGSELAALRGGRNFFTRCHPNLVIEINPAAMLRYGYSSIELTKALKELGYDTWSFVASPQLINSLDLLPDDYCDIVLHHGVTKT